MTRAATISLQLLALALGMLFLTTRQAEAAPQPPMILFGGVTVGGSAAPDGLLVEAKVQGSNINFARSVQTGATPRTSGGQFGQGSADDFTILADDVSVPGLEGALNGNPITFFVDGVQATITVVRNPGSTFSCQSVSFPPVGTDVTTYPFCLGSQAELDLAAAAAALAERGLTRVLVESGARLAAGFLGANLIDRLVWFRAPRVIGGDGLPAAVAFGVDGLAEAPSFRRLSIVTAGDDVMETYERIA